MNGLNYFWCGCLIVDIFNFQTSIMELDNPLSARVRGIIKKIRDERFRYMKVSANIYVLKISHVTDILVYINHFDSSIHYDRLQNYRQYT